MNPDRQVTRKLDGVVPGLADMPLFQAGETVKVSDRVPVGHYRVPTYLRGKSAVIEAVMSPMAVHNEEEAFGRNAGSLGFYYRISIPMTKIWSGYEGAASDNLRIEVFESWLEGSSQ